MGREYEAVRHQLAQNIRALRGQLLLSQEQLALTAEVDRTYVSQIERGTGNPSLQVLCKLAKVLKVDVAILISKAAGPSPGGRVGSERA